MASKVANPGNDQPEIGRIINSLLFTSLLIVLPCIQWSLFGWLHLFLPLLSFFVLSKYGGHTGKRILLLAIAISFIIYLALRSFDLFIFSFALLLAGYVLYRSAERRDDPFFSGLKGALALSASWLIALTLLSIEPEISVYGQFINTFDEGINEALLHYRQSDSIAADTLVMLETTLNQMKVIVPIIMPSILGSFILIITWFTMIIGNKLVLKKSGLAPWASYRYWQLPEKLIWVGILVGLFTLVPAQLFRSIGINGLVLLSIIYCFQGLAIAVFFMNKWRVPLLFRSFIYIMIIFQSLGTLLLLTFGIADIWFDFRKLKVKPVESTE